MVGFSDGAIRIAEAAQTEISAELCRITEGAIETVNQLKIKKWLPARAGCEVANLQKTTLQKALTRSDLPPATRRVIELRLNGAHAAAAKLRTIRDWRNPDGRVRGMFRYHGASTGRWTSVGLQAHNMKRPLVEDLAAAIEDVTTGDLDRMRRYPQPMSVVGDITRALFRAAPGHRLITADFSGIESRVTAWLSGEQSKIDQWAKFDRTGAPEDEPYFILGKKFGLSGEQVRPTGKTADLAFGYMGAVGAWRKLAPPDDTSTDDEIRRRQQAWRAAHPNTVRFWRALDSAAIKAVREPGTTVQCRCVAFRCEGDFLFMRLPSGREIAYPYPRLRINDRDHYVVVFMDNEKGKWVEHRQGRGAYGGIWTENAVQAVARDVFAAAMPRLKPPAIPSCFMFTMKFAPRYQKASAAPKNFYRSSPRHQAGPTVCPSQRRFARGSGSARLRRRPLRRRSRQRTPPPRNTEVKRMPPPRKINSVSALHSPPTNRRKQSARRR